MPDCNAYQLMISAMLDGELPEAELQALRAHMESCGECRKMYEAFSALEATLESDLEEPPEALAAGVMFKLRAARSRWPGKVLVRYGAIAACFVVIAAAASGLGLFSRKGAMNKSAELATEAASGEALYDVAGSARPFSMQSASTDGAVEAVEAVEAADLEADSYAPREDPMEPDQPQPTPLPFSPERNAEPPQSLVYLDVEYRLDHHLDALPEQSVSNESINASIPKNHVDAPVPQLVGELLYLPDPRGGWAVYVPVP